MKKRLFTKNRLIALLITLVAALFLGAVYIFCSPLNSSSDVFTKRTPVASSLANSSAMESFDVKYLLKDADGKTKTDIWQEVTEDAKNAGKIIYVELVFRRRRSTPTPFGYPDRQKYYVEFKRIYHFA